MQRSAIEESILTGWVESGRLERRKREAPCLGRNMKPNKRLMLSRSSQGFHAVNGFSPCRVAFGQVIQFGISVSVKFVGFA